MRILFLYILEEMRYSVTYFSSLYEIKIYYNKLLRRAVSSLIGYIDYSLRNVKTGLL